MKNSSNSGMEQQFKYLSKIKKIEPDINLYSKTINKIQRQNVISMFWVKVAASLLITFLTTEFYFTLSRKHFTSNDILIVIYKTNNILYNE